MRRHPRQSYIGGDTLSAGAAIAAPLRILGHQPIQNATPTQTMFIIVIDPFVVIGHYVQDLRLTCITFTLPRRLRHMSLGERTLTLTLTIGPWRT